MAGVSDESYQKDTRTACKYGLKCYQKNPQHHNKYKHPPKRKLEQENGEIEVPSTSKKLRREDSATSINDDAVVPEINNVTAKLPTKPSEIDVEGVSYLRTRVPLKPSSSESAKEGNRSPKPDEPPEEECDLGRGNDYIVQESPEDAKSSIEQKFLLEMPQDFFDFWDCCAKINKEKPEEALSKAGLTLVGPYDVLTGKLKKLKNRKVSNYVCHWRYYYDPPEMMTVIAGDEKEYHIGYFRDDPFQMPYFAASMSSDKPGHIKPLGGNIFAAVCSYLNQRMKEENPFKKVPLQRLYNTIESCAKSHDYPLDAVTVDMKRRKKRVVCNTFHGAGLVVTMYQDVGYREIPETNADLRRMFGKVVDASSEAEKDKHFEAVQELITNVQFAFDEGDFGMGLELGLDLFTFGGEVFHKAIAHLLGVGYDLLGREPYVDIIHAHLKNRRRGSNLSIIEED